MDLFYVVLKLATNFVISMLLVAWLSKKLIHNFESDNPRNTWRRAFMAGALAAVGGMLIHHLLDNRAVWIRGCAGLGLHIAIYVSLYRLSVFLSFGISILMSLIVLALALGLGLALRFLAAISPWLILVGLVLIIGIPLLLWWRDRKQRKLMDKIYNE